MAIGANLSPLVWLLIVIFFPLGYPLSKVLDCLLGHDSGTFYRRAELKELVGIHELTADATDVTDDRLTQGIFFFDNNIYFLFSMSNLF